MASLKNTVVCLLLVIGLSSVHAALKCVQCSVSKGTVAGIPALPGGITANDACKDEFDKDKVSTTCNSNDACVKVKWAKDDNNYFIYRTCAVKSACVNKEPEEINGIMVSNTCCSDKELCNSAQRPVAMFAVPILLSLVISFFYFY